MLAGGGGAADNPVRTGGGAPTQIQQRRPDPLEAHPPRARVSGGSGGVADNPVRTEAVLLHRYIREGRTRCRSTRPGCECQPAAPELPITPFAPGAVL